MGIGWPVFTYCDLICAPYHVGAGKAEVELVNGRDIDSSDAR